MKIKKIMNVYKIASIISLLLLAGCGGGSEDESSSSSSELEGTWLGRCLELGDDSGKFEYIFKGDTFEIGLTQYLDSSCGVLDRSFVIYSGKFLVDGTKISSTGVLANKIDIIFREDISGSVNARGKDIYIIAEDGNLYFGIGPVLFDSAPNNRPNDLNFNSGYIKR